MYQKRYTSLPVVFSADPLPERETALYVVHALRAAELLRPECRPPTWLPVLCFGPPALLDAAYLEGCSDFMREPWTPAELMWRIRMLLRGGAGEEATGVRLAPQKVVFDGGAVDLSRQEYEILSVLLRHRGVPVKREVLYYAIWGTEGGESRVVDVHVARLRAKLRGVAESEPGWSIRTVRRSGYVLL